MLTDKNAMYTTSNNAGCNFVLESLPRTNAFIMLSHTANEKKLLETIAKKTANSPN